MIKIRKPDLGTNFFKAFALFFTILSLVPGCSGMKPEKKKEEQKPSPSFEEKLESPSQEATPPSPPPQLEAPSQPPQTTLPSPPLSETPKPALPPHPAPPQKPAARTVKILWDTVNLREGPGLQYKIIGNVKKGTTLIILEERGNWFRVRLEDGKEAWVSKAATSDAPKSAPPAPSKPKPM